MIVGNDVGHDGPLNGMCTALVTPRDSVTAFRQCRP